MGSARRSPTRSIALASKQLFATLKPDLKPLNSNIYVQTQKDYKPIFAQLHVQPDEGRLDHVGARLHQGRGRHLGLQGEPRTPSYTFGTTAGNKLRELAQEIMQAQAKKSGIEVVIDNTPSRIFFPQVANEDYQLALFAWVGTGDPSGITDIYGCGGESQLEGATARRRSPAF